MHNKEVIYYDGTNGSISSNIVELLSLYDSKFKAYGLLVLKGNQGIGKGECFKRLVPINEDWVFLGEQEYKGDRDNIQILTSHLIVEFSEFARSAKKVNEFKGFVTANKDALSLKYDKYITTNKRNSIYFATVNDGEFLLDDENRRMSALRAVQQQVPLRT